MEEIEKFDSFVDLAEYLKKQPRDTCRNMVVPGKNLVLVRGQGKAAKTTSFPMGMGVCLFRIGLHGLYKNDYWCPGTATHIRSCPSNPANALSVPA